jgi:HemY protein
MRTVVWILLLFVVAVLAATVLGANNGLVSIYWAPWRIDLSLNLFVLLMLASGALVYALVGAANRLIGLPDRARAWRVQRRERAAQGALREALGFLFAGRYGRAHKSAQRALELQALTPELERDAEFGALAHLLSASALHRLQDRERRDQQLTQAQTLAGGIASGSAVAEGARLQNAEWALDDHDAERALDQLALLPAGVARRTLALRLKLKATRLGSQPLEAIKTARLLAKHQAFAPAAALGLLRSLAGEALDTARDADQLRRVWSQLDPADRRDPFVTARAARLAARLDATADARTWLRPHWEHLGDLGERERVAVQEALVEAMSGLPADWLPLLETAVAAAPTDAGLAYTVGCAMAERQLWGRARRLLETAATLPAAERDLRRQAWRRLADIAEGEEDETLAQRCYLEIARNA